MMKSPARILMAIATSLLISQCAPPGNPPALVLFNGIHPITTPGGSQSLAGVPPQNTPICSGGLYPGVPYPPTSACHALLCIGNTGSDGNQINAGPCVADATAELSCGNYKNIGGGSDETVRKLNQQYCGKLSASHSIPYKAPGGECGWTQWLIECGGQ
jgi:hypothetical protein